MRGLSYDLSMNGIATSLHSIDLGTKRPFVGVLDDQKLSKEEAGREESKHRKCRIVGNKHGNADESGMYIGEGQQDDQYQHKAYVRFSLSFRDMEERATHNEEVL